MASMGINALQVGIVPVITGNRGAFPLPPRGGRAAGTSGALPVDPFAQGTRGEKAAGAAGNFRVAGGEVGVSAGVSSATPAGEDEASPRGAVAEGGQSPNPPRKNSGATAGDAGAKPAATGNRTAAGKEAFSRAERVEIAQLQSVDARVRAHEQAHLAVAGAYATSGAHFQYAEGPDGKEYAVAGEVGIDTGKESTPEATIRKMETVRAAALAPVDPSPQDLKVAATAEMVIVEARQELQMARFAEVNGKTGSVAAGASKAGGAPVGATRTPSAAQQAASATVAGLLRPDSQLHIAV